MRNGSVLIDGGQVQYHVTGGVSVAIYQCNPGYTLSGNVYRVCQNDGNWTGSVPHCDPITSKYIHNALKQSACTGVTILGTMSSESHELYYYHNNYIGTINLSQEASVALTAVICSAVFLVIGCVLGMVLWHIISKYKTCKSNTVPDEAALAPVYEDVQRVPVPSATQAIALNENVAYMPAELKT